MKRLRTPAPADKLKPRDRVTPEEAGRAAHYLVVRSDTSDAIGLLLLCYSLAYENDPTIRENMMREIEMAIAPVLPAFDAMLHETMARELSAIRKGGAR